MLHKIDCLSGLVDVGMVIGLSGNVGWARRAPVLVVSLVLATLGLSANPQLAQNASPQECDWTRHAQIYSSAYYVEEAGDVVGEELAVLVHEDKSVEARLYDYEGAPNTDGIRLTGKMSGKKVSLQGDWEQRSFEEPSHQEHVRTVHVEVSGTFDGGLFRGKIKILGVATHLAMKRVDHIWMCPEAK